MAHTIQFVDAIDAGANVLLDINADEFRCIRFVPNPPGLRRSVSSNLMRDGAHFGPSSYDSRTIDVTIELVAGNADDWAASFQVLARLLDQETAILRYQREGATHPVFFKTHRTDISEILEVTSYRVRDQVSFTIPADSHALGLLETVSVGTVSNDPASAGGNYFDVTAVKGDVETPLILHDDAGNDRMHLLSVRRWGTPSDLIHFLQAEDSPLLGTDTNNPGGGPDATMSGSGTNNYRRTSFATDASMVTRLTFTPNPTPSVAVQRAFNGRFRIYAVVRRSAATSTLKVRASVDLYYGGSYTGQEVTVGTTTSRQLVDLGVFSLGPGTDTHPIAGGAALPAPQTVPFIPLAASRTGGSDTLDWDLIYLVPADDGSLIVDAETSLSTSDIVIDGEQQLTYVSNVFSASDYSVGFPYPAAGGYPMLSPGQTNRLVYIKTEHPTGAGTAIQVGATSSLTAYYHPRYTTIRPVAT